MCFQSLNVLEILKSFKRRVRLCKALARYRLQLHWAVAFLDLTQRFLLLTIRRRHLKEKLEKALAYEDSMAQSAKQIGLEVMGSSHISSSKRLFESQQRRKEVKAAAEVLRLQAAGLSPIYRLKLWGSFKTSSRNKDWKAQTERLLLWRGWVRCCVLRCGAAGLIPAPSPITDAPKTKALLNTLTFF